MGPFGSWMLFQWILCRNRVAFFLPPRPHLGTCVRGRCRRDLSPGDVLAADHRRRGIVHTVLHRHDPQDRSDERRCTEVGVWSNWRIRFHGVGSRSVAGRVS